jgi:hypothetical protein
MSMAIRGPHHRDLAPDAQAAAVLRDADSEYTLDSLAGALAETVNWLAGAHGGALSHIPCACRKSHPPS